MKAKFAKHSELVLFTRMAVERKLTDYCGGNFSAREGDIVNITPRYAGEYFLWNLEEKDVLTLSLERKSTELSDERLSREIQLHLLVYESLGNFNSFFHVHPEGLLGSPFLLPVLAEEREWVSYAKLHSIALARIEDSFEAQTELHNKEVIDRLRGLKMYRTGVVIAPQHGLFSASVSPLENFAAIDGLASLVECIQLRRFLRSVPSCV